MTEIGKTSFIESHGSSAASADINAYVNEKYTCKIFKEELGDPKNIYHIIYHDKKPAGYSKIIFNAAHANVRMENVSKLERIIY